MISQFLLSKEKISAIDNVDLILYIGLFVYKLFIKSIKNKSLYFNNHNLNIKNNN